MNLNHNLVKIIIHGHVSLYMFYYDLVMSLWLITSFISYLILSFHCNHDILGCYLKMYMCCEFDLWLYYIGWKSQYMVPLLRVYSHFAFFGKYHAEDKDYCSS